VSGRADAMVEHKLLAALDRLARAQRLFRQDVATRHGLSPLQGQILQTLAGGSPPEPLVTALARELGVTQPTVTEALGALERKRLVTRRVDPADGRRWRLALTKRGRALAEQLATADQPMLDALGAIAEPDRARALETLLDLIARLHGVGVITVARTCTTCRFHEVDRGGHYCRLLDLDLAPADLRVDCAEHQSAA
jgi:DNA-binding MarR family transcriptional regulator